MYIKFLKTFFIIESTRSHMLPVKPQQLLGVLEANFVEPAHDKQGFERTIVLSRLESRLIQIQKDYW